MAFRKPSMGVNGEAPINYVAGLGRGATGIATGCRGTGSCNCDRGGRRYLECLLELLYELTELDQRHFLECVQQFICAELRHVGVPFSVLRRAGRTP